MSQPESPTEEPRRIKSVTTACRIVDALVERNGAGVTELADHLDLSKGSVHTHLATLQASELVIRDGEQYRPSFRFLEIGEQVRRQEELISVAKPKLDELAETTGDRVHLAIEEHGQSVLAYAAVPPNAIASTSHLGRRRNLHCTSAGKAILAHLPPERIDAIVDEHGLPEYTANTITDRDELLEELETIREEGVAYNRGENVKSLRATGAPITDANDVAIGSISLVVPPSATSNGVDPEQTQLVKNTANVIEINYMIRTQPTE